MLGHSVAIAGSLFAARVMAQFNIYPSIDSNALASALNISLPCLSALNETVECDQTLFQMAGNVDAYFWDNDNATALCTSGCMASATSWWSNAADQCENDQLNAYGKLYPAETVPGRFIDGMNIVCVTANTDLKSDVGVNGTILTTSTVNQYNSTYTATYLDPSVLATQNPLPYPTLAPRQDSAASPASNFCLIQSYSWVGSDIIRPDCGDAANANASQCIDPTDVPPENGRIANLYPNSLLCSKCFLNLFFLRLASPYLPDVDASDDLITQWFDILDVCKVSNSSMPQLIVRDLPFYDWAPGTSGSWADNTTSSLQDPLPLMGNQTYNNTCTGRTIVFADLGNPPTGSDTLPPCQVIPPFLNASTGDVQRMMGDMNCLPTFNVTEIPAVCAPLSCETGHMPANSTCDEFAQSLSGGVTTTQLLTWNPNMIGLCTNTTDQIVCTSAPGGTYISPPSSNSTTNEGTQQRGGGNGGGTSTGSGGVGGSGRNSTTVKPGQPAPSPVQSGIDPSCTQYAAAQSGDGCYSFSQLFDVTLQALYQWNTVLGKNGESCTTDFFAGYYYCIGVKGTSTTTPKPTPTPTTSPTPSPVQSGIDPKCTSYAEAVSGDYCSAFATENNISTDELYQWNPVLGQNGANCNTAFFANYYYCVGVPASPPPPPAPSPTQSGIAANCDSYTKAVSGDSCYGLAQENGITTASLYMWNTVLGNNGANCGTALFAGYYYCIGVSS